MLILELENSKIETLQKARSSHKTGNIDIKK